MSNISKWSTTASANNSASPDGFAEGQLPSSLNDCAREVMAAIRRFYESAAFIDLGHTPTYASATTFTIATDVTSYYVANRRIKCTDATTLYGKITSSVYVAPNTTVTVTLDSGSLSASLTAVAVGLLNVTGLPVAAESIAAGALALASLSTTGNVSVGGTLTSTKSVQAGFARLTPNYCHVNSISSYLALSVGKNTIAAPSANAKAVVVRIVAVAVAAGSVVYRTSTVGVYQDTALVNSYGASNAFYLEPTGTSAGVILSEIECPVTCLLTSTGASFFINLIRDSGNQSTGYYAIVGYYD